MADRYSVSNSDAGEAGHLDEHLLTAFVDGDIDDPEMRERVRTHLSRCAYCRKNVAELRALVSLLGELPEPVIPRSFHLDASMVPERITPLVGQPVWYIRHQPALRRLTALAAVLLVSVLFIDVLMDNGPLYRQDTDDSAPAMLTSSNDRAMPSGSDSRAESPVPRETPANGAGSDASSSGGGAPTGGEAVIGAAEVATGTASSGGSGATAAATQAVGDAANEQSPEVTASTSLQSQPGETVSSGQDTGGTAGAASSESPAGTGAIPATEQATARTLSPLAITELALALIVIWLLVATVLLPRIRSTQR